MRTRDCSDLILPMLQRDGVGEGPNRLAERRIAGSNDRLVEQKEISKDDRRADRIGRDPSGVQHCETVTRPKDQLSFRSYSTAPLVKVGFAKLPGNPSASE